MDIKRVIRKVISSRRTAVLNRFLRFHRYRLCPLWANPAMMMGIDAGSLKVTKNVMSKVAFGTRGKEVETAYEKPDIDGIIGLNSVLSSEEVRV
ncbi:MAG: hypothetical protein KJ995_08075 [Candidatus Omnitrophica bacterium]|nr:hypothetical protein [Candidatus Omnitrophota bacterium]MBU1852343.1 hypothetical protein [Candidatus Omnitrophota bacterium]